MQPFDIVGYTYRADNYCSDCIVRKTCHVRGIEGHGLSSVPEQALDLLARLEGIDRGNERSFDSDDFPKVIFRDSAGGVEYPEQCGSCGKYLVDPLAMWTREARHLGEEAGRNAGSWAADGNTDPEHAARVLKMLEDGDPESESYLPAYPTLSGEWADDPTPLSLARDVTGEDDPEPDLIDALADAWEEGVGETFESACETELRAHLPEREDA